MTPGARQVAQLTAWAAAQKYALGPIREALEELSKLENWSGGFLVVDTVNFDWRKAPFKTYESFDDFYRQELELIWAAWDDLQDFFRLMAHGHLHP